MILINPASSFNQHPIIRWSSGLTPWIPAPFYQLSTYGLLPLLAALERIAPHNRQILLETMQTVAQKTSAWRLSLLEQFKIQPAQLRRITQPVLLIAGAADRLLPSVKEVKRLAQYFPKARVRILPQSGHACLLEEDVNLYDILRQENALEPSFFRAS
jgi:pimeloyl-ACP methyl ester carboxylesterase